jgi:protein translocase SEC61 complex gamma subunit
MGMGRWLTSAYRTLKLTRKSDREEFMLYLKLVLLGFGVVGAIGFIIYFLAAMLMLAIGIPTNSSATP